MHLQTQPWGNHTVSFDNQTLRAMKMAMMMQSGSGRALAAEPTGALLTRPMLELPRASATLPPQSYVSLQPVMTGQAMPPQFDFSLLNYQVH